MKKNITLLLLIFLSLDTFAQYKSIYKVEADSNYLNYHESNDKILNSAISSIRQVLVAVQKVEVYSNDSFIYVVNKSFVPKKDTSVLGNKKLNIDLESTLVTDWIWNKKRKKRSVYKADSILCYPAVIEKYIPTDDTATINGWMCKKWVSKDTTFRKNVSFWISTAVPKQVCNGHFSDDFDGGIVMIEDNREGTKNVLVQYEIQKDAGIIMSRISERCDRFVSTPGLLKAEKVKYDYNINYRTD